MSLMDAKKRMYDEMEEYAGNEAAKRSGPLAEFQGKGTPIAHESVTVVAAPKGQKPTPEELREKVGKMGLLPDLKRLGEEVRGAKEEDDEAIRRALEDAMRASR